MTGKRWEDVSEEAKEFIKSLLVSNPYDRPPIKHVLEHSWLEGSVETRHVGPQMDNKKIRSILNYTETTAIAACSKQ